MMGAAVAATGIDTAHVLCVQEYIEDLGVDGGDVEHAVRSCDSASSSSSSGLM